MNKLILFRLFNFFSYNIIFRLDGPKKSAAIDAFGKIASSHPTARLIVAKFKANESYEAQIRARINELGLQERVLFFDRLKRNEFIAFLKGCDCLIIPEQWENMSPVVLCEAMYASKPVIASKVGGIPEFISDGYSGILVERNDVNGFAHAMDSLLSSETKRLAMGNNARQAAEAIFDETRILDVLMKFIERHLWKK